MCFCNVLKLQLTKNLLLRHFLRKIRAGVPTQPWYRRAGDATEHHTVNHHPSPCVAAPLINRFPCFISMARTSYFCHFPKLSFHFYPQKWLEGDTRIYTAVRYSSHQVYKKSAKWICCFPLPLARHFILLLCTGWHQPGMNSSSSHSCYLQRLLAPAPDGVS